MHANQKPYSQIVDVQHTVRSVPEKTGQLVLWPAPSAPSPGDIAPVCASTLRNSCFFATVLWNSQAGPVAFQSQVTGEPIPQLAQTRPLSSLLVNQFPFFYKMGCSTFVSSGFLRFIACQGLIKLNRVDVMPRGIAIPGCQVQSNMELRFLLCFKKNNL